MKTVLLALICLMVASSRRLHAAPSETNTTAVVAEQEAEERYNRLAADVQTLLETQELIQKNQEELRQTFESLEAEIRNIKEEQNRFASKFAQELEYYANKLTEVDQKRVADTQLILTNIAQLAKIPAVPAVAEPVSSSRATNELAEGLPEVYAVKKNDTLLDILALYNANFQRRGLPRLTRSQLLEANPGLKPDRLRVGQGIHIPMPAKDSK